VKLPRLLSLLPFLLLTACAQMGVNKTVGGTVGGAAIGSGVGAIIGSATGRAGPGTAIGAGVGAVTGAIIGSIMDSNDAQTAAQNSRLDQTDSDIAANQRLINELRARGIDATQSERGVSIHLPDVLFGFNRSDLTRDADYSVKEISDIIRKDAPGREILVEGHTDAVGSPEYNLRLSDRRADSVARELINNGTDRRLLRSRGFGESKPLASNDSETGRARNRRVEIVITR
jgi:outer membrane protein OmpA-like peptidoglycan-associated protein